LAITTPSSNLFCDGEALADVLLALGELGALDDFLGVGVGDVFFGVGDGEDFLEVGVGEGFLEVAASEFSFTIPGTTAPRSRKNNLRDICTMPQIV
jgi:hypothetical protein